MGVSRHGSEGATPDETPAQASDEGAPEARSLIAARRSEPRQERDLKGRELRGADLRNADLRGADLRASDLRGADLRGSDLTDARLDDACLQDARFGDARVHGASFAAARLARAELATCVGLLPGQLAATDLDSASLPAELARFEALAAAEESSKSCRTLFIALLAACLYCLLTIGTTSDANLKLGTGTSQLPFVDVHVPPYAFYHLAPWLLFAVFVYLQLYLQRLWDRVACLPAIFHDGRRLDEALYPWLIAGLVRTRVSHLRRHRVAWSALQAAASCVLGWMLVPAVLAALFWRALPAAQPWLSLSQGIAVVLSVVAAYWTWREGMLTLSHGRPRLAFLPRLRASRVWEWSVALALASAVAGAGLSIWQERPGANVMEYDADLRGRWLGGVQSLLTDAVLPSANLESATLQEARLQGANLMNANLRYAVLQNAQLQGANLTGADMTRALLERADVSRAVLHEAVLYATNLDRADLSEVEATAADLRAAKLNEATLDGAQLWGADLTGTFLLDAHAHGAQLTSATLNRAAALGAQLNNASLAGATLTRTDFGGASLNAAELRDVQGEATSFVAALLIEASLERAVLKQPDFEGAYLDYACLAGAELKGANMQDASLQHADLRGAKLAGAKMAGANLEGARLEACDLTGVDLTASRGLTHTQLARACGSGELEARVDGVASVLGLRQCPQDVPPRCASEPQP